MSLDQLLTIQCVEGKIRNSAPLSVWRYHEGLSTCHAAKHWRFLHSTVCILIAFADNIEPIRMRLIPAKSHWYADYGGGYSTTTPLQWIRPLIGRHTQYTHQPVHGGEKAIRSLVTVQCSVHADTLSRLGSNELSQQWSPLVQSLLPMQQQRSQSRQKAFHHHPKPHQAFSLCP